MKLKYIFATLLSTMFVFSACKKEAGPGGTSSIRGKVYARYYNKTYSVKADSAYAPDIDVYIIYGNDFSYGERTRTSYDGSYEFRFLQKGTYTIFAYSKDTTGAASFQANQFSPDVAVKKKAEITKGRQKVVLTDIEIIQ